MFDSSILTNHNRILMFCRYLFSQSMMYKKAYFHISCLLFITASLHAKISKVVFQVDMNNVENVTSVSVRGSLIPLSWENGVLMTDEDNDGIYKVTVEVDSPYRFLKFKFLCNGDYELKDGENRAYDLSQNSSPIYIYNQYLPFTKEEVDKLIYTEAQIEEDIDVLRDVLVSLHPGLYDYQSKKDFESELIALERNMKADPTLVSSFKLISEFVAKISCSHTFTNLYNQGYTVKKAFFLQPDKLPLTFMRAGNSLLIDRFVDKNNRLKKGLEIISINGMSTSNILTDLAKYVSSDGNNYQKKLQRLTMSGASKYELFDLFFSLEYGSQTNFQLVLKDHKDGNEFTVDLLAISKMQRDRLLKTKYADFTDDFETGLSFEIQDKKLAVMRIKTFANFRTDYDFEAFVKRSIDEMNQKEVENFVIDIRENEGGNSDLAEYLLKQIIQEKVFIERPSAYSAYKKVPDSLRPYISTWDKKVYNQSWKVVKKSERRYDLRKLIAGRSKNYKPQKDGYKGKVFLLTSAENSSATHLMATFVKKYEIATIVGQETGGNQRGLNAGVLFFTRLPNTKIEVDVPVYNIKALKVTESTPDAGILPDIMVERKVEDIANGIDPEMTKVMELIGEN